MNRHASPVKVLGIGSLGSYFVRLSMSSKKMLSFEQKHRVACFVMDTDPPPEEVSPDINIIRLESNPTENFIAKIEGALRGAKVVILVAGLGGGCGSVYTPIVAKIARDMGIFTVCLITTPYSGFEGNENVKKAQKGIEALLRVTAIPILFSFDSGLIWVRDPLLRYTFYNMEAAFHKLEGELTRTLGYLIRISFRSWFVWFMEAGPEDIRQLLLDKGFVHFAVADFMKDGGEIPNDGSCENSIIEAHPQEACLEGIRQTLPLSGATDFVVADFMKEDGEMPNDGRYENTINETLQPSGETAPYTNFAEFEDEEIIEKGSVQFGTYRVESIPETGGMGKVWRVRHTGWNIDLAMKRPKASYFQNEQQKAAFKHECEAWMDLGLHPQIVSCYYVREIGGVPSIFSEWMEGGNIKKWIKDGRLYAGGPETALRRILDIAIQCARGLHYIHERRDEHGKPLGLIHQDVKPENLLLTPEGDAKVTDFGLASAHAVLTLPDTNTDLSPDMTIASEAGAYTPAYCSMEQLSGGKLTRRTDIYSWAVSVLEMFLGRRPWDIGTEPGVALDEYFAMKPCMEMFPEAMKSLLRRCLNPTPEKRPHDFGKIDAELVQIYRDETGTAYPREISKAAGHTADSLNNRALSYLDMEMPEKAEECWKTALEKNGDHIFSRYNYTLFLWTRGEITDEAAIDLLKANSVNTNDYQSYYLTALLQEHRGDTETAAMLFNKAESLSEGALSVSPGERMPSPVETVECIEGLYPQCAAFNKTGELLVMGFDSRLMLYDVKNKRHLKTICIEEKQRHRYSRMEVMCFLDDEHIAVSSRGYSSDYTPCSLSIINLADGEILLQKSLDSEKLSRGCEGAINVLYSLWMDEDGTLSGEGKHEKRYCQYYDKYTYHRISLDVKTGKIIASSELSKEHIDSRYFRLPGYYHGVTFVTGNKGFYCLTKEHRLSGGISLLNEGSSFTPGSYYVQIRQEDGDRCVRSLRNTDIHRNAIVFAANSAQNYALIMAENLSIMKIGKFGPRPNWFISRVSDVDAVMWAKKAFADFARAIDEKLKNNDLPAAYAILKKAEALPDHAKSEHFFALNDKFAPFCKVTGIHRITCADIFPSTGRLEYATIYNFIAHPDGETFAFICGHDVYMGKFGGQIQSIGETWVDNSSGLAMTRDGKYLLAQDGFKSVLVFDFLSGKLIKKIIVSLFYGSIASLVAAPDGHSFFIAYKSGRIAEWRISGRIKIVSLTKKLEFAYIIRDVIQIAVAPNRAAILGTDFVRQNHHRDGRTRSVHLYVYSRKGKTLYRLEQVGIPAHRPDGTREKHLGDPLIGGAFSLDGKRVAFLLDEFTEYPRHTQGTYTPRGVFMDVDTVLRKTTRFLMVLQFNESYRTAQEYYLGREEASNHNLFYFCPLNSDFVITCGTMGKEDRKQFITFWDMAEKKQLFTYTDDNPISYGSFADNGRYFIAFSPRGRFLRYKVDYQYGPPQEAGNRDCGPVRSRS